MCGSRGEILLWTIPELTLGQPCTFSQERSQGEHSAAALPGLELKLKSNNDADRRLTLRSLSFKHIRFCF